MVARAARMASGGARVVIFEAPIDLMHQEGGMVFKAFKKASRETVAAAKGYAPKRTSNMANSIRSRNRFDGRKKVRFIIVAEAPYSYWVHEGTRDGGDTKWIRSPTPGKKMLVPKSKGSSVRVARGAVRGQPANPFLRRAAYMVFMPVTKAGV